MKGRMKPVRIGSMKDSEFLYCSGCEMVHIFIETVMVKGGKKVMYGGERCLGEGL